MSMDDILARAKRYPPDYKGSEDDENDEVIYPTNRRYMVQILTPEICKKQVWIRKARMPMNVMKSLSQCAE